MHVEVDEPDALAAGHVAGHRAQPDRAVAAEHEQGLAGLESVLDPFGGVPGDRRDRVSVLRARILRVGAPAPHRRIAEILDLDPRLAQALDQARGAQRGRRLLLAGRERARAGGYSEDFTL